MYLIARKSMINFIIIIIDNFYLFIGKACSLPRCTILSTSECLTRVRFQYSNLQKNLDEYLEFVAAFYLFTTVFFHSSSFSSRMTYLCSWPQVVFIVPYHFVFIPWTMVLPNFNFSILFF